MFSKHMFIERKDITLLISVKETPRGVYKLTYFANNGTRAKRQLQMRDTIDCSYRRQLSVEEQNAYYADDSFRIDINKDLVIVGRIEIFAMDDVEPADEDGTLPNPTKYDKIRLDAYIFPTKLFNTASQDLHVSTLVKTDLYMSFSLTINDVIYNVTLFKRDSSIKVGMLMHGDRLGMVGYITTQTRRPINPALHLTNVYWMNEIAETEDGRLICYGFSLGERNGFTVCDSIYEEDITDLLPVGCKIYDYTNHNCSGRPNLIILCNSAYNEFPSFYLIDPALGASPARSLNKEIAEMVVSFKWYCQANAFDVHCATDCAVRYGEDAMLACCLDNGRILYSVDGIKDYCDVPD